MSDSHPNKQLLAAKYIQGTLREEEAGQLLAWLRADPELLAQLRMNLAVDIWLEELLRSQPKSLLPFDFDQNKAAVDMQSDAQSEAMTHFLRELFQLSSEGYIPELNTPIVFPEPLEYSATGTWFHASQKKKRFSTSHSSIARHLPQIVGIVICVMAIIVPILLFTWHSTQKSEEFLPVASVVETIDAVWEKNQPVLKRGQATGPNRVAIQSGLIKLRYASGAEVILEGPGEYVLSSESAIWCDRGRISALIPKEAVGYEILTPFAKYIDRGTEFAVEVSETSARLDVLQGKVDVSWSPDFPMSGLTTGMAAKVGKTNEFKPVPIETIRYIDRQVYQNRLDDYVAREKNLLEERTRRLQTEPNMVALYTLNEGQDGTITNRATANKSANVASPAMLKSVTFGEGFLPETRAALLNRQTSAIEFNLPGQHPVLSLAVRLRIDRLQNTGNVLLASDEFYTKPGSLFWQILGNGRIQVQIRAANGRITEFLTEPVYLRPSWGTWCDLVLVLDATGKKVQCLLDDQVVLEKDWPDPIPIELGRTTVGNVEEESRLLRNRYLGGALAEIAVFADKINTFR